MKKEKLLERLYLTPLSEVAWKGKLLVMLKDPLGAEIIVTWKDNNIHPGWYRMGKLYTEENILGVCCRVSNKWDREVDHLTLMGRTVEIKLSDGSVICGRVNKLMHNRGLELDGKEYYNVYGYREIYKEDIDE